MSALPPASADYSLRILWPLARWIEDKKGADALEHVAEAAGVRARDILVEVGGTPDLALALATNAPAGFLTLKLSDTGEGIRSDKVARIFRPRPANEPTTAASYGLGLSSVVRLLAQIGGRLEVMTEHGVGTTFWVHFPVRPPTSTRPAAGSDDNIESMITRVVTVREAAQSSKQ